MMFIKLRNAVFVAFIAILFCGCAGQETAIYSYIDNSDKTIKVPPGHHGIKAALKNVLVKNNWTIDEFNKIDTKYELYISTGYAQLVCLKEWTEISYEIFVVEKASGEEILSISGTDCDSYSSASEALELALRQAEK